MREKVGKSRNTVFFQWFVAPEGRKVGSLKRRVQSQLARWEMKNCTSLWREAHFQVRMSKNTRFGALFEVELSKKCTRLWREAHLQVKKQKSPHVRSTFGSWDDEKVHAVVAQSTFPSQNVQNTLCPGPLLEVDMLKTCTFRSQKCKKLRGTEHFWTFRCRFAWQAQGIVHLVKSEQNVRVL